MNFKKIDLFKILTMMLLLGNIMSLAFAEPNFGKLRDSDEILETAESKALGWWEYFVTAIEMVFAGAFLFSLAGYNLTKDEGKAAAYKKWMIRSIIATILGGAYLGYLYS